MRKYLVIIIIVLMASCNAGPISVSKTNNPQVNVEFLFEIEGNKVYRFRDGGYDHYVVIGNTAISTETAFRSGKITRYETTPTIPNK